MITLQSLHLGPALRALTVAFCAAITVGCGGGGGGVDTGGTGGTVQTFSSGRIAGFGSVIVNGVRFDDSTAEVKDDDDAGFSRSNLKLGMVVDVVAGAITTDAVTGARTGTAKTLLLGSEMKGPVQAVNIAAGTLTVLDQVVTVDASTVFDDFSNRLTSVQVGDLVELHSFFDANAGSHTATRIERKTSLAEYKLRGRITSLTGTTMVVGGATISFANIPSAELPALSVGLVVRVKLSTIRQGSVWVATKVRTSVQKIPDHAEVELEGFVTDFVSLANFKVNGIAVDASSVGIVFEHGTSGQVANGVRLEVEGEIRSSVLVARKVEFKHSGEVDEIELHGTITSVSAVGVLPSSFVVRGNTVVYDAQTRFEDRASVASLVIGARVEVKAGQSATGNFLLASKIKVER